MSYMQPLRDEYAELIPHIAALAEAGDAVGSETIGGLRKLIEASYSFLTTRLIPRAKDEERSLYPVLQWVVGAPEATATMQRDHVEIGRLTDELTVLRNRLAGSDELDKDLANEVRRVLYGLHALVNVHFAKVEEVFLPILEEGLDESAAATMFTDMHGARPHLVLVGQLTG